MMTSGYIENQPFIPEVVKELSESLADALNYFSVSFNFKYANIPDHNFAIISIMKNLIWGCLRRHLCAYFICIMA